MEKSLAPRHPKICYEPKPVIENNYFHLCFQRIGFYYFFKFATIDHAQVVPMEVLGGGGRTGRCFGGGQRNRNWPVGKKTPR